MQTNVLVELGYILSSILFIFGIKPLLGSPKTAVKGKFFFCYRNVNCRSYYLIK